MAGVPQIDTTTQNLNRKIKIPFFVRYTGLCILEGEWRPGKSLAQTTYNSDGGMHAFRQATADRVIESKKTMAMQYGRAQHINNLPHCIAKVGKGEGEVG